MTVKTHRGRDTAEKDQTCRFCDRIAGYYSQNVRPGLDDPPLGAPVIHCQAHRAEGRQSAEVEPTGWEKLGYTLAEWQALSEAERFAIVDAEVERATATEEEVRE